MAMLTPYLPVVLFTAVVAAALWLSGGNRIQKLRAGLGGIFAPRFAYDAQHSRAAFRAKIKTLPSVKRVVFGLMIFYLASYIWIYQRMQDAIAAELKTNHIAEVAVGSLVLPYSAFFRSALLQTEYSVDAGFAKSRKRARIAVDITGGITNLRARIHSDGLAELQKLTGNKFVFAYLTDLKILRPAIDEYMGQLIHNKQIAQFEIETFDNRGPYILVVLPNQQQDANARAASLATDLHKHLTQTQQLQVSQVVIKVVDAQPYLANKTIRVIARGTAGNN